MVRITNTNNKNQKSNDMKTLKNYEAVLAKIQEIGLKLEDFYSVRFFNNDVTFQGEVNHTKLAMMAGKVEMTIEGDGWVRGTIDMVINEEEKITIEITLG